MRMRRTERVALKAFLVCAALVVGLWLSLFLLILPESRTNYSATYTTRVLPSEYSPREYAGVVLPPCVGTGKDCEVVPPHPFVPMPHDQRINTVPEPSSLLLAILASILLRFSLTRRKDRV